MGCGRGESGHSVRSGTTSHAKRGFAEQVAVAVLLFSIQPALRAPAWLEPCTRCLAVKDALTCTSFISRTAPVFLTQIAPRGYPGAPTPGCFPTLNRAQILPRTRWRSFWHPDYLRAE